MSGSSVPFTGNHFRHTHELEIWASQRVEEALEPDLPIIDPHHHLWDDDRGRYLLDEFLADVSGHNVVATVYAQYKAMYRAEGPTEMQPVGEVEFVNGLAAVCASGRYGPVRVGEGIIAFADLLRGDDVRPVLEALVAAGNGRLKGIRHGVTWDDGAVAHGRSFPPRHLLLDPAFQRGFAHLGALGLNFDAWLFYPQLPELERLLERFPETSVTLDHAGGLLGHAPHQDRKVVFAIWREAIQRLSRFPNLTVKIGGLGMLNLGWDFHLREQPPGSEELAQAWQPYVDACIDAFGTGRCMFESNFPMDKQSSSYSALWNAFKRITRAYSSAEKAALYHDNAVRTYRLPRACLGVT